MRLPSLTAFVVSAALLCGVHPWGASAHAQALPAPQDKFAALMVDAVTGEVLHQEMADQRRYPASLTKIMTLYIAFDELAAGRLRPADRISVSALAARQPPSRLGLREGETMSVEEAMNAVAIKSANDAAVALAEHIAGSEAAFADRMTRQALALGMRNTRFRNASGLPDAHQVTTATDMAILARAVLRDHPQQYRIFSRPSFEFRGQTFHSHNRVTHRLTGADGLKTGYIRASGFNLVTSAARDGRRLVGVVMGGRSGASRDQYMEGLFQESFSRLALRGSDRSPRTGMGWSEIAAHPDPIAAILAGAGGDSMAMD